MRKNPKYESYNIRMRFLHIVFMSTYFKDSILYVVAISLIDECIYVPTVTILYMRQFLSPR